MKQSRTFKAALLGSGKFLATLTGLICAAILARLLTKSDYASYRQTLLAYTFVSPLLMLGLPTGLFYFLARDRKHGRSILSGNLLLLFLMGIVFFIAIWSGLNELLAARFNNPALKDLLLIYSPYALLALPAVSISACLVSYNRVKSLTFYNVLSKIIIFGSVVGFALIWRTPEAVITGTVAAAVLIFIPALILMYRATPEWNWRPTWLSVKDQIIYSVPLGMAGMVGILAMNLDKVLVSSLCPPEEFAVYVNGAIELPVIAIITSSVIAILIPEFSLMYQQGEFSKIISLWHRAMVKCALLIFPIMVYLLIMAPEAIRVLFSARYEASAIPFRIYLLLLPIRITHFGSIFMAAGKNSWILFRTAVTLILNLILSIILIRQMGYVGAAIATVIIIYLWSIPFNLIAISKLCEVSLIRIMPYGVLLKLIVITGIPGLLCLVVKSYLLPAGDISRLAITGIIYAAVTLALMIRTGLINRSIFKTALARVSAWRDKQ